MKRFYKHADTEKRESGFVILLDGRPIKTPNKQILTVPTLALAQSISAEWNAVPVDGEVVPHDMHMMCLASTVIDKVLPNVADIQQSVISYADTDVLCYRSETYQHLHKKQQQVWDVWVSYAGDTLHMPMTTTTGIMPISQPPLVIQSAKSIVKNMTVYQLTAFADMVAILGSFVMATALVRKDTDIQTAFAICYLDEAHQTSEWGTDVQAEKVMTGKHIALEQALQFYQTSS